MCECKPYYFDFNNNFFTRNQWIVQNIGQLGDNEEIGHSCWTAFPVIGLLILCMLSCMYKCCHKCVRKISAERLRRHEAIVSGHGSGGHAPASRSAHEKYKRKTKAKTAIYGDKKEHLAHQKERHVRHHVMAVAHAVGDGESTGGDAAGLMTQL